MAKVSRPVDVATQVDLVHVNCGVHLAPVLSDEATGAAVFQCPRCKGSLAVTYFDQTVAEKEKKGEENLMTAPAAPSKRRSRVSR